MQDVCIVKQARSFLMSLVSILQWCVCLLALNLACNFSAALLMLSNLNATVSFNS